MDIDFEFMYPNKGCHLLTKWPDFRLKIVPIFKERIKDKLNVATIMQLEQKIQNKEGNLYL